MPALNLHQDFESAVDAYNAVLSRDLPLSPLIKLHSRRARTQNYTDITSGWILDHGTEPHNLTPMCLRMAFVKPEAKKQGYFSGIAELFIHSDFHGLGIGKILLRNAIGLFRQHGDSKIELNTQEMGAHFWQSQGFTGAAQERDLNDEENSFSDWEPKHVYESFEAQVKIIHKRLTGLKSNGYITGELHDRATATLDPDAPQSIWKFLEIKDPVTYQEDYGGQSYTFTEPLSVLALKGLKTALELNFNSNSQMQRIHEKTANTQIDPQKFGHTLSRYIATERRQYQQEIMRDLIHG